MTTTCPSSKAGAATPLSPIIEPELTISPTTRAKAIWINPIRKRVAAGATPREALADCLGRVATDAATEELCWAYLCVISEKDGM